MIPGEMNQPVSAPYSKKVRGKEGRVLVENFEYDWGMTIFKQSGFKIRNTSAIIAPAGMFYDGASIPTMSGLLWRFVGHPFDPEFEAAAVIHDLLYSSLNKRIGYNLTRKQADLIFREILKQHGVGKVKRNIMYQAVRRFGWMGYGSPAVIIPEYTK